MDRYTQLLVEVDAAFAVTARGMRQWDDPHPDRSPLEEEYSRLLDPAKWQIVGARVDAWIDALTGAGLADLERDATVAWVETPRSVLDRVDRLVPRRRGTVPLVVVRRGIDDIPGLGVTIGAGDPAVEIELIPDCGCDACDSGSQDVIDQVDRSIGAVVRGEFRHLWRRVKRPPRPPGFWFTTAPESAPPVDDVPFATAMWALPELETIMVLEPGWSTSNLTARRDVDAILADPTGWTETTGRPWFTES